ncbi:PREDICTED: uncharacterized protein LOC107331433 [Acropora digitifera]|uniref:uncharacterized protein LOC107331433 n=1 Tax=Acropora digitifera TaxID=70779 RepID=UPI00077A95C2|nr:PREDICTED: uncharacterized protein LOC107331433 [Acropora digitifera]
MKAEINTAIAYCTVFSSSLNKGHCQRCISEISHIRLSVRQLRTEFSCLIIFFFSQIKYLTLKLCCYRTYESKWGYCKPRTATPKTTIQPKKTTITVTPRKTKTTLPIKLKISTTKTTIQPKKTTITVTPRKTKTTLPIKLKISTTKTTIQPKKTTITVTPRKTKTTLPIKLKISTTKTTIQPKKTTITVTPRKTKTTLPIKLKISTTKTTIQPKKTTITVTPRRTKTTLPITPKISTTKPSSSSNETKKNATQLTTPWRSSRNPLKATDKSSGTFRKPGWIVLFCLMAVCLALLAVAGIHTQTRKKISRSCCGAYGELSTDADTTSVLVEGHHEESVAAEPINNATPIPPTEEAMLLSLRSHSTTELCYSNGTDEAMDEQMKCTCAMKASGTLTHSHSRFLVQGFPKDKTRFFSRKKAI